MTDTSAKPSSPDQLPGVGADKPTEIPSAGWRQILVRAWKENKDDQVPLMAAGLSYFAFLAMVPALIALLTVYGLVADPKQAAEQVQNVAKALPDASRQVITDQLQSLTSSSGKALSLGLIISLLGALWSASGAAGNLIKAVNRAYDEQETRGFLKVRGTALVLTLGGIVFVLVALGLIAVVPALLNSLSLGGFGLVVAQVLRFVALVAFVAGALAVVYRVAPDRDAPKMRWVSLGALVATALWVIGSVLFALYVNNFSSYNKTYGALAGIVVLLLWLYLTSYIVLFGAEINSEAEHQTARDTTKGPELPMGDRRAVMADTLPE